MKKNTETYLIIGGVALVGLYLWYTNSQATAQASAAAAVPGAATATPGTATTAIAPVATTEEQAAAPVVTDVTQPGVIDLSIIAVEANSQGGAYNCLLLLAIQNNATIPVQLQNITGTVQYDIIAAPYAMDKMPSPYTGIIGPINDSTVVTIPAGQTATKWYQAIVPVTSATNLYLSSLAYNLAADTIKNQNPNNQDALYFYGTMQVNGVQIPFKIPYIV